MIDEIDELGAKRIKTKLSLNDAKDIKAAIDDAVAAWFDYQEARERIAGYAAEMLRQGFNLGASAAKGVITDEAFRTGIEFMTSPRLLDAVVDEILDPAVASAEASMMADAEQEEGVCRHAKARMEDGAPEDAIVLPCAIVEMFGIQTGDAVQNIACPGCHEEKLLFRIWRPKQVKWAVPLQVSGDDEHDHAPGPWLECAGCGGWSLLNYKTA